MRRMFRIEKLSRVSKTALFLAHGAGEWYWTTNDEEAIEFDDNACDHEEADEVIAVHGGDKEYFNRVR